MQLADGSSTHLRFGPGKGAQVQRGLCQTDRRTRSPDACGRKEAEGLSVSIDHMQCIVCYEIFEPVTNQRRLSY